MANSNAHPQLTVALPRNGGLPMLQSPTPVLARRAPAYSTGFAVQAAPLPNPTGLPSGAPDHRLVMLGLG